MGRTILSAVAAAVAILCAGAPAGADDSAQVEASAARARAEAGVTSMSAAASRVRTLLQRVRAARHADRVACVDATLSRADVAYRYGRDNASRALEAYARGAVDEARREMTWLSARVESSRLAARDADACVAGLAGFGALDRTVVQVTVDPRLPRDIPTYPNAYPASR